jgi:hypothetical protein
MSATGVFTRMKRFRWVEKLASEVGALTDYPLPVSLEQLAEIAYRVRDMRVSDGGSAVYTMLVPDFDDVVFSFVGSAYDPPASPLASDDFQRGYRAILPYESEFEMPTTHAAYFGEEYSIETPFGIFRVWDIADDGRGMWLPELDAGDGRVFTTGFAAGLSFDSTQPENWTFEYPGSGVGGAGLVFGPEVAFVDLTGSGNPLDPGNELFMYCFFAVVEYDGPVEFKLTSYDAGAGWFEVGRINLNIVLSSTTVTMPVAAWLSGSYDDFEGSFSGTDIEITAKAWWPYAKPGGPVWNAATGARL